jgi:predicted glutamine amidotransferase
LFGLTAGTERVQARFWLLDAPDSLGAQGRRNPDGTGIGWFDEEGRATVDKQAEPAYSDVDFIGTAMRAVSRTFVAHVRVVTTGEPAYRNTHPFLIDNRLMAHNGGFAERPRPLHGTSDTMGVHAGDLRNNPSVVVASEPMDENQGWRELEPGELLHVGQDLTVTSTVAVAEPPTRFELPAVATNMAR